MEEVAGWGRSGPASATNSAAPECRTLKKVFLERFLRNLLQLIPRYLQIALDGILALLEASANQQRQFMEIIL